MMFLTIENNEKLVPFGDRIFIRPNMPPAMTGKLHLPDKVQQEKMQGLLTGTVIAVGPGVEWMTPTGITLKPMRCKVGDTVVFHIGNTSPVKIGDELHVLMGDDEVFGRLDKALALVGGE